MSGAARRDGYVVPSYRATGDTPWYHFLHGNVPGHQIDFMYRPEVPQGPLSQQHFSHLSRLMKYIEPQTNGRYAFAIGNLSRDDTQHEPGHGGVALMFGLRIQGVTDHAGRENPPFAHGIAAIDRALNYGTLLASARSFHRHVLGAAESAEWYRTYVRYVTQSPELVPGILQDYVARFDDLPRPASSAMSAQWTLGGNAQPRRVVIVHAEDASFELLARCAARIAATLYCSDIRWTSISNGREADVPNGVSIRFASERDLNPTDLAGSTFRISEVPEGEAEIARHLFGAKPLETDADAKVILGWRERFSTSAPSPAPPLTEATTPIWQRSEEKPALDDDQDGIDVQWEGPGTDTPGPEPYRSEASASARAPSAAEPAVGPPEPPPAKNSPWEPRPAFRRRRAPLWRWTLIGMAACAGLLLLLYRVFGDDTSATSGAANGGEPPMAMDDPTNAPTSAVPSSSSLSTPTSPSPAGSAAPSPSSTPQKSNLSARRGSGRTMPKTHEGNASDAPASSSRASTTAPPPPPDGLSGPPRF